MKISHPFLVSGLQGFGISILSLILGYVLLQQLWFCSSFVLLLLVLSIASICHYNQRQSEAMKRLISAINFNDYSLSFNRKGEKGVNPSLAIAMEEALNVFRQKAFAFEEEHLYYTTLLRTIDSGLIVLNQQCGIEWYNQATLHELQLNVLNQLSDLQNVKKELPEILLQLKAGETKVIRLKQDGRTREIAFNSILFCIKGKKLSLISLKNVHTLLDNNEIEAWQKLISVLTHEIMNSMAPIISLSETLIERNPSPASTPSVSSASHQALLAIHRRSKGLLEFVQNYRKLTRIPAPHLVQANIQELFLNLQKLHNSSHIKYHFVSPDSDLQILLDPIQIEQVLINLIRNAEEACSSVISPTITVAARNYADRTVLSVEDNGPGIIPEAIDKIFVPFFTTKPGGSGIGLSLCKQIMTLHQGYITVDSNPGQGTCFQLIFNKE